MKTNKPEQMGVGMSRAAVGWMLAMLGSACALAASAGPAEDAENQILVRMRPGAHETAVQGHFKKHGAAQHKRLDRVGVRVLKVAPGRREAVFHALRNNPDVELVERDCVAVPTATANDTFFNYQWHLPKIACPSAWDITKGQSSVIIAVIDSGVYLAHADLATKLVPGYDFYSGDGDASDEYGHGTAVTGAAGACANNSIGVAGIAWNNCIMPLKVTGAAGTTSHSLLAEAITYAADHGARVINMSFASTSCTATLQSAIDYAWSKNVVIVASAGNYASNLPQYPAACTNVVAVTATQADDTLASWSSYGSHVAVTAPGVTIWTTNKDGNYGAWSGTSFASPIVAGVAALVASVNPELTGAEVVDILKSTADDVGAAGFDEYFGHGRVNASLAVQAAKATLPADTTAPTTQITSPKTGATVSGTISIAVTSSDNVGVTRVDLYIDGKFYKTSTSTSAVFTWNTKSAARGTHTLQSFAWDAAGNMGSSAIVSVKR